MWECDPVLFEHSVMIQETTNPSFHSDSTQEHVKQPAVNDQYRPLLTLYSFFLLMFQTLFRLSDKALNVLLSFFAMFFGLLAKQFPSLSFKSFVHLLPSNIATIHRAVGGHRDEFEKYVCCPSCHSIYPLAEFVSSQRGGKVNMVQKKCSYVRFPNHPQHQHRKPCGTPLMKLIKIKGTSNYSPRLLYCYRSIIKSLQEMLKQPAFLERCEAWRKRQVEEGTYSDVFDGKVWNDFLNPEGVPFLSLPYNYALQLNVDWFNPYERTTHSEGAIYISIMNLPRNERFLQENVMLVGVIPGPQEPSLHMNSLLQPLVNDLLKLWKGVILKNTHNHSVLVRAALLCSACDIPASRKVCGFVGHNAIKGCNRCLLSFPTEKFGDKPDFSNFDRSQWLPRTNELNRDAAKQHKECNTQTQQHELEQKFGVRYTLLNELPYFDASRMTVIDPMHNLLLGTAKHMVEMWKSSSLLNSKDMDAIQAKVDSFVTPPDIGRIPTKIFSGFSGFTAEQWKNWTIYFSLYALKDHLHWQHYNCWHLFVKACYILCRRKISQAQLQDADKFIAEFCELFSRLYGPTCCTMNMHLHGHLVSCIQDYGPVYAFWCFAYERLNGVLGSYHTNHHHISAQFMRRFLDSKVYAPSRWPEDFVDDFLPLLKKFQYHKGSL